MLSHMDSTMDFLLTVLNIRLCLYYFIIYFDKLLQNKMFDQSWKFLLFILKYDHKSNTVPNNSQQIFILAKSFPSFRRCLKVEYFRHFLHSHGMCIQQCTQNSGYEFVRQRISEMFNQKSTFFTPVLLWSFTVTICKLLRFKQTFDIRFCI